MKSASGLNTPQKKVSVRALRTSRKLKMLLRNFVIFFRPNVFILVLALNFVIFKVRIFQNSKNLSMMYYDSLIQSTF